MFCNKGLVLLGRFARRSILMIWMMCCAVAVHAAGPLATLSADDEVAARGIVEQQLAAFAADDAKKAFSFAAPAIQAMFKTAANFMAMVRSQYPVVYRPASVTYFKPEVDGDLIVLRVHMTDANGTPWLAIYSVQRSSGKAARTLGEGWRIAGCVITTRTGRVV